MINIEKFIDFLKANIQPESLSINEFKPELKYAEWDFNQFEKFKITIQISGENISIATISREPEIDFSLYDHYFDTNNGAENFIKNVIKTGKYNNG